jgi:hypothetical protein
MTSWPVTPQIRSPNFRRGRIKTRGKLCRSSLSVGTPLGRVMRMPVADAGGQGAESGWVLPTPGWACSECGFDYDASLRVCAGEAHRTPLVSGDQRNSTLDRVRSGREVRCGTVVGM